MTAVAYKDLNALQRWVVIHAHPAAFVFHLLALIWGGYCLWLNRLGAALVCFILPSLVGHLLGRLDKRYRVIVSSSLNLFQKLLLYHFDLKNVVFHLVAFGFFIYGMWTHLFWALLTSISLTLLGNITPWLRHGREEAQYALAVGDDV